jgi:hypothetical protein
LNNLNTTIAAAVATLIASAVGLVAVLLVAVINARAARTLARANALREYRERQGAKMVAFVDRYLRRFRLIQNRRAEPGEYDALAQAVAATRNVNLVAPILGATGDRNVAEAFYAFVDCVKGFVNTIRICDDHGPESTRLIDHADRALVYAASLARVAVEGWVFGGSRREVKRSTERQERMRAELDSMLRDLDNQLHAKSARE